MQRAQSIILGDMKGVVSRISIMSDLLEPTCYFYEALWTAYPRSVGRES